jgi:DNA-binding beta-propeller fold protein YncE
MYRHPVLPEFYSANGCTSAVGSTRLIPGQVVAHGVASPLEVGHRPAAISPDGRAVIIDTRSGAAIRWTDGSAPDLALGIRATDAYFV